MAAAVQVLIREVAPRDGFQSWPEFVPTELKLEVIRMLMEAGVREMETTSFVSPKAIPQMRDAAEVLAGVPRLGCIHSPLVPNLKGAERALESGADKLVVVISVSEAHNLANVRRTVKESLSDLQAIFELARRHGKPVAGAMAVAFGCPYQGEVPEEDVYRLAEAYISGGAASLVLADTVGMATPPRVKHLVQGLSRRFPGVPYALHLHNNRGTAMANLYAALEAGADTFDAALGGIGGCPNVPQAAGNLATEDVVYMLEDMGCTTGIDLMKLIAAARRLEAILGRTLPGQVMKSGPRDPRLAEAACGRTH
jgi:hydroxymethylglutaryl-CoA lyase